ncbi:TPA: restriction endonuclease subunit S [Haemophilus influenzae]|uniref:restriction endonuclease subunit S n=1 Tax=Haemophilus influenzae TaxID=727 RepID=UPI001F2C14CF|nr:restriction endonuclease subunit S [Haemophilus influenzae]
MSDIEWIETTVGEYCPFIYGKALPQSKRIPGNIPVYGSNGIVDFHNSSCVNTAGVIIGRKGSVGAIHLSEKPFWVIDTAFYIVNDDLEELKFTYYLLKTLGLSEMNSDSAVPGLNRENAHSLKIKIPKDKFHRCEIGKRLSIFDQKIQLNTQINQTLEQIAQALFKSWFVDFDPVRAKVQALSDGLSLEQAELAAMQAISGKTPEELTALSQTQPDRYAELAETAKAFPCEMVEVDGVEVPRGWEMKALSDLGQIICGKTPSKSNKEFYGDDVPFIKIPDMHNQVFITQTTDNLSVVGANYQSKKYIPAKSICVSCIATVGLVSMTSKPSHTNQQINSIIPDDEQSCEFLYLSLKQPSMTKYLKDLASGGTATFNLNTSTFSKIEIITPSKEIIYIFQKKVVSIFEKTLSNSIENKRLTEIRDLLLPRLLNGEI